METVIVERSFPSPTSCEAIAAARAAGRWCADLYGVTHRRVYVDLAGHRAVCVYRAPDVEAVRHINRRLDLSYDRLWRGTIFSEENAGSAGSDSRQGEVLAVVERTLEAGTDIDGLSQREAAGGWCLDQHRVRFLRAYVAHDGRRTLCIYAAPDAESVRIAQRTIAMPVDRVWPAQLLTG